MSESGSGFMTSWLQWLTLSVVDGRMTLDESLRSGLKRSVMRWGRLLVVAVQGGGFQGAELFMQLADHGLQSFDAVVLLGQGLAEAVQSLFLESEAAFQVNQTIFHTGPRQVLNNGLISFELLVMSFELMCSLRSRFRSPCPSPTRRLSQKFDS